MSKAIVPGPTYAEMRNPHLLSAGLRAAANAARADEQNGTRCERAEWIFHDVVSSTVPAAQMRGASCGQTYIIWR